MQSWQTGNDYAIVTHGQRGKGLPRTLNILVRCFFRKCYRSSNSCIFWFSVCLCNAPSPELLIPPSPENSNPCPYLTIVQPEMGKGRVNHRALGPRLNKNTVKDWGGGVGAIFTAAYHPLGPTREPMCGTTSVTFSTSKSFPSLQT